MKKYWKLFAKKANNLTKNQIWRLEKSLSLDENLKEAYYIKAYFDRYVTGNKREEAHNKFDDWIDLIQIFKIPEIKILEKTNVLAKGINNRIKVIKRQSYGIRKFENLRNLLLLRIS